MNYETVNRASAAAIGLFLRSVILFVAWRRRQTDRAGSGH